MDKGLSLLPKVLFMRILLVGEYSNFHNSLKYGLEFLGHEVTIVGDGDGFKKFPVDIYVGSTFFEKNWFLRKLRVGFWKLTKVDLTDRLKLSRFRESEHLLKNHDIVQFINSNPFGCSPYTERKMLKFLLKHNDKFFLSACGDDVEYVKYLTEEHQGYSILESVKNNQQSPEDFIFTYKYLKAGYVKNYELLLAASEFIIPSNTDYAMALRHQSKATSIIPAAVNCAGYQLDQNADLSVIQIFMGINRSNYWKKGINYFEEALEIISKKYKDRVNIQIAEDLPYSDYMKSYKNSHIVLDQVLGYDQGYNALEAMLQGKVVFCGGSQLYLNAHDLESVPVIDARPDVDYLVEQLSDLIDHSDSILSMGIAARNHIIYHHESVMIAQRYLELYTKK